MVPVFFLMAAQTWAATGPYFSTYAVYDGKSSGKYLNTNEASAVIDTSKDSKILVVNRDNNKAVVVSWGKAGSSVETNVAVAYNRYFVSSTSKGSNIASKDVVSITLANDTVLLGSLSASTKGESVTITESLNGESIDDTSGQQSYADLSVKYNLSVSISVNGSGGQAALNAYILDKTKGAVTEEVPLP